VGDAFVSQPDQVLGCHVCRPEVVDHHRRYGRIRLTIDQHGLDPLLRQEVKGSLAIHRVDDDQAVDQPFGHRFQAFALALRVVADVVEDDLVAAGMGGAFHRLGDHGVDGVGDVQHQQTDQAGLARAHTAGDGVRAVVQLADGVQDALARAGGDTARAVDHAGHRLHGNTGEPRHVLHGGSLGGHATSRSAGVNVQLNVLSNHNMAFCPTILKIALRFDKERHRNPFRRHGKHPLAAARPLTSYSSTRPTLMWTVRV